MTIRTRPSDPPMSGQAALLLGMARAGGLVLALDRDLKDAARELQRLDLVTVERPGPGCVPEVRPR